MSIANVFGYDESRCLERHYDKLDMLEVTTSLVHDFDYKRLAGSAPWTTVRLHGAT